MSWLGTAWDYTGGYVDDKTGGYGGKAWDFATGAVDNTLEGAGLKDQKPTIDVKAGSAPIIQKSDDIYAQAMAQNAAMAGGPQVSKVNPWIITGLPNVQTQMLGNAPILEKSQIGALPEVTAGQVTAGQMSPETTVSAGDNVSGEGAAALREQRLAAANQMLSSPSAAAASMRASQAKIGRQMLGVAAGARGADRVAARRAAMLGIGANGMQAGAEAAALAAQEEQAKRQAYATALGQVQAGDVAAGQASTTAQVANLNAEIAAKSKTLDADLAAQVANLGANTTAQTTNLNAELERARLNQTNDQTTQAGNLSAWLDARKADQAATLDASKTNAGLELQRQTSNQGAGVTADTATNAAILDAYKAQAAAGNAYLGTALGAGSLQNQNLGVQTGYGAQVDAANQRSNAAAAGTASSFLNTLLESTGAKSPGSSNIQLGGGK